ncbi:MAG: hypothetical protein HOP23_02505 [Methylococcaceae bacterium]|nr:hypothetical protein [Methylococcaceae bacterium]
MIARSFVLTSIHPERLKNGEQVLERSRGGLNTKIHAVVDGLRQLAKVRNG